MINSHPSPQTEPIGFHLSQEKLFQLLADEVSPTERQQMEAHIQTCPLCSEALEGFSQTDYSKSQADVLELNHLIKKRTTRRKSNTLVNDIKTWGVATAIIFLILISAAIVWNAVHTAKTTSTITPASTANMYARPVRGYENLKSYLRQQQAQALTGPNKLTLKKGKVIIKFTVNPNGSLTDFEVVKSLNKATDQAAIEFIKNGPEWQPGSQRGKQIAQKITLPIIFK